MDKEKEKQYMMTAIMKEFNYQPPLSLPDICEGLVNQGYGNVKQAVKEFAAKAWKRIHEILDLETDYTPSMICRDIFDRLIKELYGDGDHES